MNGIGIIKRVQILNISCKHLGMKKAAMDNSQCNLL